MNPSDSPHPVQAKQAHKQPPARPARSRKPLKRSWIVAICVVAALGYFGIAPRLAGAHELDRQVASMKNHVPSVRVVHVQATKAASEVSLPASVLAIEATTINARTSGYVSARYVDIGTHVKAGQVLAVIQSPEMDQQVLQAQAEAAHAVAGLGQSHADLARLQASISHARSELSGSQANLGQSRADLAHLQAKLAQAKASVNVSRAKLVQATKRLDGTKAELSRAKVGRSIAEKTLTRWKELEKADAVSGQDVDETQSAFDASQARVDAAQADVSSAEADVEAAKETVKSAEAEVTAAEADLASGSQKIKAAQSAVESSQANVAAAEAGYQSGQSGIAAAEATVGSSEANAQRYSALQSFEKITAPFDGVITARNVDVGDLVNPTTAGTGATDQANTVTRTGLFGLAQTDTVMAQVNVPEDNIAAIHEGQPAEITVREYPERAFPGTVFHLSGALDSASRTLLVEVRFANKSGLLKPGMSAVLRFLGAPSNTTIRVPATALIEDAKGTRVAVVGGDGRLQYVPVKEGRDYGDVIEILEGLHPGDVLITDPDDSLQEGAKVQPVEASKS